jgi:hypothetical protein
LQLAICNSDLATADLTEGGSIMHCLESVPHAPVTHASITHAPIQEYRVNHGKVESRVLDYGRERETGWKELSPAQLSSHVKRNTKVAQWLEQELGWRGLLRACVGSY